MKKSTDQVYKVNIGGAINKSEGWINLDIERKTGVDIVGDGKFFRPYTVLGVSRVDVIRCSHVLEHFFPSEIPYILKLYYKYLKEGGELIIGVPDLDIVIKKIQDNSRKYLHFWEQNFDPIAFDCLYSAFYAFPITNANQHLKHYTVFNELSLQSLLESVGFKHVKRFRCKTMDENHGFDDGMLSPSSLNMICTK
ncbi:MAG: hypothetical protein LGR52_12450 [Candidatus Thiosymbion ectosymbiont of Robbea hypermnestra]|nr:hypothetical protein [Candidatus Thiosymbion ectosymbiont of Robbea hypermnestra]